jgi:hypothetical protein
MRSLDCETKPIGGSSNRAPRQREQSCNYFAYVGMTTLQCIEQQKGVVKGNFSTILKIQNVLWQAGIHFSKNDSGDIGVRPEKRRQQSKR